MGVSGDAGSFLHSVFVVGSVKTPLALIKLVFFPHPSVKDTLVFFSYCVHEICKDLLNCFLDRRARSVFLGTTEGYALSF